MAFERVAFIGLGQMGLPMAGHLAAAGFPLVGFDLSAEALGRFERAGGKAAPTLAAALTGADAVITMLPNGKIVQDVLFAAGDIARAQPLALLIDMSSSAPPDTRALHGRLPPGMRLVDAPVSGGVKRAVEGTLAIMAGGDAVDVEQAQELFRPLSAKVIHCGPVGAGHAMKAINNYVSGAGVIAAVEAVQLGEAFGLAPATIVDALNASTGKNNATDVKMKQFVLSGTFASGFALGLMAKDIRIAAELSKALGLHQDNLQRTADTWDDATRALGGTLDHTKMAEFLGRKPAG